MECKSRHGRINHDRHSEPGAVATLKLEAIHEDATTARRTILALISSHQIFRNWKRDVFHLNEEVATKLAPRNELLLLVGGGYLLLDDRTHS